MQTAERLRLVIALAARAHRPESIRRLTEGAKASALFALIEDPQLGVLVPAPGFSRTLPGGRLWQSLLEACREPGLHRAELPPAPGRDPEPAIACACPGAALVFVGADTDVAVAEDALSVLPAVGSALLAEHEVRVARGALIAAQENARDARDLTRALDGARRDLEAKARSLDEARGRAEKAVRAKDEFLALLGHELRNPLAPIVTALQLMELSPGGDTERERSIIERQVGHLIRLVDDLLDVSRITRGKLNLKRVPVELSSAVARAIELSSPILEQRSIRLAVDVPETGLLVKGDQVRLAQVISNLLMNAAKYTDVGGHVWISAEDEAGEVVLRVRDDGIGIEPELLPHIFEMFVQEQQSLARAKGGLGLGLTIVRSLVHLHDGRVRVHSAGQGRGSEFVVSLPTWRPESEEVPAVSTAAPPSDGGELAIERRRVLIVDDNVDAALSLSHLLQAFGCRTRVAHDGPSALAEAADFCPEVALLDIGLPVMDGYELARRLRETGGVDVRLIAITGYGQESDKVRAREAGFEAHLAKPVDSSELVSTIQRLR